MATPKEQEDAQRFPENMGRNPDSEDAKIAAETTGAGDRDAGREAGDETERRLPNTGGLGVRR
jgi:hypothetical protein